jgi:hypothetical protein
MVSSAAMSMPALGQRPWSPVVASLLTLIAPRLQAAALDPALHELLASVPTSLTELTTAAQPAGLAPAGPAWRTVRSLLPVTGIDTPPFGDGLAVDARLAGRDGWEVGIALPAIDVIVPGAEPGVAQELPDGRSVVRPAGGTVTLHVESCRVVISAAGDGDPAIDIDAAAQVTPDLLAGPAGFGVRLGQLQIGAGGTELGELEVFLPPLPQLPTGPLPAPARLGRPAGVFAQMPETALAAGPGSAAAAVSVTIDRPAALSIAEIVPSMVTARLPLGDVRVPLPGAGTVGGTADGDGPGTADGDGPGTADGDGPGTADGDGPGTADGGGPGTADGGGHGTADGAGDAGPAAGALSIEVTISVDGGTATLRGVLTGDGDDRGVARLNGSDSPTIAALAIAGALGPYLTGTSDGGTLAALIAAAAAMTAAVDPAGVDVVLQAVTIGATWTGSPPAAPDLDVSLDYECQLPFSFGAGPLQVATAAGWPYRVRHRGVGLSLSQPPRLSWREASATLVSPGRWQVAGVPGDLVRVSDVRTKMGSLDIELDLRLALDLSVVTVDQSTVRVSLAGGNIDVTPAGFGIGIDLPGVITGRGQLSYLAGRLDAALDVDLPALGIGASAAVGIDGPMVFLAIQADLPAPIPFAATGLGLYGAGGVLATSARPSVAPAPDAARPSYPPGTGAAAADGMTPGADPIAALLSWTPWQPGAWQRGSQTWIGFTADIGTVPDFGFALQGSATILIGLPDPGLRAAVQASILHGVLGVMTGVMAVDATGVAIAVQGHYQIPALVEADVAAGAFFDPRHFQQWLVRVGGDRTPQRGEPVTAHVLPDILDLQAWTFLMAFGDASTVAGAALADGRGLQLHGMSLAFGAGFDVHWSAGPFSFAAGGFLLATLTHFPAGDGTAPWVLAGQAGLHGKVDLGPVSIGASAELSAFADPSAPAFYADARACASIDLWFTEISGCVHLRIGSEPALSPPDPATPLIRLALTDRLGHVVADAATSQAGAPTVWPDTIPVLVFDTWVGAPAAIPGLAAVIGSNVPDGDGWAGPDELAYRFDISYIRVFETGAGDTEIGTTWTAAWQLPLTADVFGGGAQPAQARSLALNVLDLHHWLQPAVALPAGAPGDPVSVMGGLCDPVPQPAALWFPGDGAVLPPRGTLSIPAQTATGGDGDPRVIAVWHADASRYPADSSAPVHAGLAGCTSYRRAGIVPLAEPADIGGHQVGGVCWLPLANPAEKPGSLLLRFDQPFDDGTLYAVMPGPAMMSVRDSGGPWQVQRHGLDQWVLEVWRSNSGGPVSDVTVQADADQQVGLLGVSVTSSSARLRWETVDASRAATHDALEHAATQLATARRLMRPGLAHRIDVGIRWSRRGSKAPAHPSGGDLLSSFWLMTAPAGDRPDPAPPAGPVDPAKLVTQSKTFLAGHDESVLASADLARYVAGFVPPAGTARWFCGDPVQVVFLVDHLTELAAAYDSVLTVTARRTDAGPAAGQGRPAGRAVSAAQLTPPAGTDHGLMTVPLTSAGMSHLDQARFAYAVAQQQPGGCQAPRPGAAAAVPVTLEPDASYRVTITVAAGGQHRAGSAAGSGAVIAEAAFTTSRYASAAQLLADLGFAADPAAPAAALASFPLPAAARMPPVGAGFDDALEALGLGGYRSEGPQAAALWQAGPGGSWAFAGLLIECPEPINRPGRLDVQGLDADGVPFGQTIWDSQQARVLALMTAPASTVPGRVGISVTDSPPGAAASTAHVVTGVTAYSPPAGVAR